MQWRGGSFLGIATMMLAFALCGWLIASDLGAVTFALLVLATYYPSFLDAEGERVDRAPAVLAGLGRAIVLGLRRNISSCTALRRGSSYHGPRPRGP